MIEIINGVPGAGTIRLHEPGDRVLVHEPDLSWSGPETVSAVKVVFGFDQKGKRKWCAVYEFIPRHDGMFVHPEAFLWSVTGPGECLWEKYLAEFRAKGGRW